MSMTTSGGVERVTKQTHLQDHRKTCLRCQQSSVPNPNHCYEGYILWVITERAGSK